MMLCRAFLLSLVLLLSGCSFWSNHLGEPKLVINITAADNINPNFKGQPSPVELRIYQLTNSNAFEQSNFIQIYNDEQSVLTAELAVVRQLLSLMPGEVRQEVIPLGTGVKFIGVIAGFADYRAAKNKVIYEPIIFNSVTINIEVDGINLSISGEEGK